MDEVGFELAEQQAFRRVGQRGQSKRTRTKTPKSHHLTTIACVGPEGQYVRPQLIYSGSQIEQSWFVEATDAPQSVITTDSGWIDSYVMKEWLFKVFDSETRGRAAGTPRLLFLDGTHIEFDIIDECVARNIYLFVLPAHISDSLQPLNVAALNELKSHYTKEVELHQGSQDSTKAMYLGWHKTAWEGTITEQVIRAGWRASGLWPLDETSMCPESPAEAEAEAEASRPVTPERQTLFSPLHTPYTARTRKHNETLLRLGQTTALEVVEKLEKVLDKVQEERDALRAALAEFTNPDDIHKKTRRQKRISYTKWVNTAGHDQWWTFWTLIRVKMGFFTNHWICPAP